MPGVGECQLDHTTVLLRPLTREQAFGLQTVQRAGHRARVQRLVARQRRHGVALALGQAIQRQPLGMGEVVLVQPPVDLQHQ